MPQLFSMPLTITAWPGKVMLCKWQQLMVLYGLPSVGSTVPHHHHMD